MTTRGAVGTNFARRSSTALTLVFVAILLAACGAEAPSQESSSGPVHIRFALKTSLRGILAPLVVARDKGYFREEGLEVELVEPASNTDSTKLIAAGDSQMGNVDAMPLLFARNNDIPLVSVATTLQHGQIGIIAPKNLNLTSPTQLSGKTVAVSGLPGQTDMFRTVLKKAGVNESDVKIVEVGFKGAESMAAGKVAAVGDGSFWTQRASYNVAANKPVEDTGTVSFLDFESLGAPRVYINNIVTTEDYLRTNSATVKGFLRAFVRATEWSISNPSEAFNVFMAADSELDPNFHREQFRETAALTSSKETDDHGIGWQEPKVWQDLAQYFQNEGLIKAGISVDQVMTNDYLPGKTAK